MLDIISGDIAAACAATKNKRGRQIIIDTAQPTNGSRTIDYNPAGINSIGKFFNNRFIISKNSSRVSSAAGIIYIQSFIDAFFNTVSNT